MNRQAHLTGWFQAYGGGNDIFVGVVDEQGYANFSNRSSGNGYYWSRGYVVSDNVDLMLNPGNYYVVFDNRAALITNKVVKANFSAE